MVGTIIPTHFFSPYFSTQAGQCWLAIVRIRFFRNFCEILIFRLLYFHVLVILLLSLVDTVL